METTLTAAISVDETCIKSAQRNTWTFDPISHALRQKGFSPIRTMSRVTLVEKGGKTYRAGIPTAGQELLRAFDNGQPVEPVMLALEFKEVELV